MNLSFVSIAADSPGIVYAFKESDIIGKGIVLLLLIFIPELSLFLPMHMHN